MCHEAKLTEMSDDLKDIPKPKCQWTKHRFKLWDLGRKDAQHPHNISEL